MHQSWFSADGFWRHMALTRNSLSSLWRCIMTAEAGRSKACLTSGHSLCTFFNNWRWWVQAGKPFFWKKCWSVKIYKTIPWLQKGLADLTKRLVYYSQAICNWRTNNQSIRAFEMMFGPTKGRILLTVIMHVTWAN